IAPAQDSRPPPLGASNGPCRPRRAPAPSQGRPEPMVTMIINRLVAALALATAPADSLPPDVDYRIEAILDEEAEVLRARAELRYTNHATTALDTLWLHQHLNAFLPNSAWAQRELEFGNRRFQDLGPEAHA